MKPMLACSKIPALSDVNLPVIASPKLDGIRCLLIDGVAYSRTLKPIPNKYIQQELAKLPANMLDGELMLKSGDFNNVQSAVMSVEGRPDFMYQVFDCMLNPTMAFQYRIEDARAEVGKCYENSILTSPPIALVEQRFIKNLDRLEAYYNRCLELNYEGLIIRDPHGPYKYGRSTMKQGWMLKLKHFSDAEAIIVDVEELMHNGNLQRVDEVGAAVRSHHQDGLIPGNTLGSLVVEYEGHTFKIGTGFDTATRSMLWGQRDNILGQAVTFKYQELSKYGVPRFPVFKGLRYE